MRRLVVIVLLALAGFVAALVTFDDAAWEACLGEAPTDPAYTATLEPPVRVGEPVHELVVERDGEPVTGARVCTRVGTGDDGQAVGTAAREVAPGAYEVPLDFGRAGDWQATVLLAEDAATPEVAITFDVQVAP